MLDVQVVPVHRGEQGVGQAPQRDLAGAGDVVDPVGDGGGGGQQVGPGDVLGVDEVHRLGPVAEDQRRLSGGDPLHPADEHLGVPAVHVHPGPVHVEVAQRDVVQAGHGVEGAQQALVEDLGRPVQGVVVVRVVVLGRREDLGEAVDGGGGRGDHLADADLGGRLDHVEGAVHHDLQGEPGLGGALGDPDRGQVEEQVGARVEELAQQGAVADVAVHHPQLPGGGDLAGVREVGLPAPDEVVEHDHLAGAALDQLVHHGGADGAGPAGHQAAGALDLYSVHRVAALS